MSETLSEIEGKYEILEKLQVGGMGAIYKVRHRLLGDERVVKVMRPQLVHDPELRQRFHREARAATRLTHPNVARLYDFSVDAEGNAYIVMEFIPGWTLDDLIARGELPPLGLALEIADQSLKAIGHLHAHGVIHRDISPDNLMLTRDVDGRAAVKLIDLGLIKSLATSGDLTATGVFVGKFRYASPEQFGHGGAPGPPSDLYSFGLVLYELLTGRYPIVGKSASSLIAGHIFRAPLGFGATDLAGRVPEELRQAVMRALAKEPADRYPSAAAFAAALAPIRRRHELEGDAARRLLELIREPPKRPRPRRPSRGSTQSRFDRQFGSEPTPRPESAAAAVTDEAAAAAGSRDWVRRVEAKIAANDFAAAREELRRAVEAEGETPELWEIGERIAVIEEITAPPAPPPPPPRPPPAAATPSREVEAELVEVEALRAAGRLARALELARALRERAPRHKLVKQVVVELERETAAARPPAAADSPGPTQMLQSVRSQVEKELNAPNAPADARRQARRRADELVARARELARSEDFAAAGDLLRRALELRPDHPEGLVLQISVDTCVEVQEEEVRSEQKLASSLRDLRDLVAAGKTESALHGLEEAAFRFGEREELRALQQEALRAQGEEDDEAALAVTTPLEIYEDDAARAETELLPQVRAAAEPAPAVLTTQPLATVRAAGPPPPPPIPPPVPPPVPPPSAAPATVLRRSFDEISLRIPRQPRADAAGLDAGDLPLGTPAFAEDADAAEPPPKPRTVPRNVVTGAAVVAAFLAIGLGLAGLLSGPAEERIESVEVEAAELTVSGLLTGLDGEPSAPLRETAEAYLAGDFEQTLAAAAAGSFATPREEAWGHLLRAAAHYGLYVRGGEQDPGLRERTLEEIRAGRAAEAGVVPGDGFSPSFLELVASTR